MRPNDVLIEVIFKLFILLMFLLAVLSFLDLVLQIAIIVSK
jgi:hypothetical protein